MIVHAGKIWRYATDRIYTRGLPVTYVYAGTHLVYPESKPYDGRYNLVQNGYAGRIAINGIPITGTARESIRYNLPLGSHGLLTDNTNLNTAIRSRLGTDVYNPLFWMNQGNWGENTITC